MNVINKNSASRTDLKLIINHSMCNDQTEILVKSMVKSTKNLKIKSIHKILELVTRCN